LRAALGPRVALANPLDYHTYIWGDRAAIAATFSAMMAGDLALGVVILDFPRPDRCDGAAWHIVIDAVADTMAATGRPMAILSSLPETMPEDVAEAMIARGIVPLCGMAEGVAAMAAAARCGAQRAYPSPLAIPAPIGDESHLLTEAEAKTRLAARGVAVPRAQTAHGPEEAAEAATALGFPVVLKALGIAHKTDAGAVALHLSSPEAVAVAATRMGGANFLIEEMITGGVVELLVGVIRDPAHGFVLTLGAGGVLTERLADTVSLLLPAEPADIRAALDRLRIAPLLHGYRGAPAADLDALVAAIEAVQACALAHQAQLHELEINPLIATPERAIALDALFRLGGNP
jgi:acyl-CoA synthetase (NDP forming)